MRVVPLFLLAGCKSLTVSDCLPTELPLGSVLARSQVKLGLQCDVPPTLVSGSVTVTEENGYTKLLYQAPQSGPIDDVWTFDVDGVPVEVHLTGTVVDASPVFALYDLTPSDSASAQSSVGLDVSSVYVERAFVGSPLFVALISVALQYETGWGDCRYGLGPDGMSDAPDGACGEGEVSVLGGDGTLGGPGGFFRVLFGMIPQPGDRIVVETCPTLDPVDEAFAAELELPDGSTQALEFRDEGDGRYVSEL